MLDLSRIITFGDLKQTYADSTTEKVRIQRWLTWCVFSSMQALEVCRVEGGWFWRWRHDGGAEAGDDELI